MFVVTSAASARFTPARHRLALRHTGPVARAVAGLLLGASLLGVSPAATAQAAKPGFNPEISLILSGGYLNSRHDTATYSIRNIALPPDAEVGPGSRGLAIGESELGLTANIDPWTRGVFNLALGGDDSLGVEEAYVQSTALSNGLTLKVGRHLSGIGYLNEQHAHTWDFVDAPLAYQALLGGAFGDDGLQLRWIAPTALFVELGAEVGQGRNYPGSDGSRNGAGASALFAHVGGDIGSSQSWRAGLSLLSTRARDQELAAFDSSDAAVTNSFTGTSRITVLDFVWKWAPEGNATRRSFKLQGEWLTSRRRGELTYDTAGVATADNYSARAKGGYLQAVWGFAPGWRAGLRQDRVDPGTPDYASNAAALALPAERASKTSLMVDWSPSEFSRLRLQVANDKSGRYDGVRADNRVWMLQYQVALGAHGAHGY
ncbi:MAG: hypothetical protein RL375_2375 [Pseudomonadota bacterium]